VDPSGADDALTPADDAIDEPRFEAAPDQRYLSSFDATQTTSASGE
jgi:hypothetical protein